MKLSFEIEQWVPEQGTHVVYLQKDSWDDFGFKTSFHVTLFDEKGIRHEIGSVKIAFFGQKSGLKSGLNSGRTEIPSKFVKLDEKFFSLGQDADYYKKIQNLNKTLKDQLLTGLNDIVLDEQLLDKALEEEVTSSSLLRNVDLRSIKVQFKRILSDSELPTEYHFRYGIKQSEKIAGLEMDFHVNPESNPPTNIHVLIGRNGVGKTYLLNNMAKALVDINEAPESVGEFLNISEFVDSNQRKQDLFAGVVSVSFSAFDPFEPIAEQKDKLKGMRYFYVGLKRDSNRGGKRGTPMSHDMLAGVLVESLGRCIALGKIERWKTAIKNLETDPLFEEMFLIPTITECLGNKPEELEKIVRKLFKKMSSGHGVVVLTITKLVEKVEERTLVLIDEPEGHLHPPLLSAFVRALSGLLSYRNGVAIVATHSPVVVQEVPKSCVWKLRRTGYEANVDRPEIETFGENIGALTREIFRLEVTYSGYHKLLKEAVDTENSYEDIVNAYNGQLGLEAKSILRGLLAEKEKGEDQ